LTIGGLIIAIAIFNGVSPAINQSSAAIDTASTQVSASIESQIKIITATASGSNIYAWVKNTGTTNIDKVEDCDIFYGPQNSLSFISYGSSGTPNWSYSLENGCTTWGPEVTCEITISLNGAPTQGIYVLKVVTPNGVSDYTVFAPATLPLVPTLSSIAVTPASPANLFVGATQAFTATGTYSDGSTANITSQVVWGSDTPNVATIDYTGLATGVAAGTADITASLSGVTSPSITLTVVTP
jgi:hypothetical protein